MRWRRVKEIGREIGMRKRRRGRTRWEKEAPKGKVKDVGVVEIHRTFKGIVPKERVKQIGREAEVKDIRKEMRPKAHGAKEMRKAREMWMRVPVKRARAKERRKARAAW